MIEVLPYSHISKGLIGSIEDTVTIVIQITKRIESASSFLTICLDSINTKKLTAIIDRTISVAIKNEETIVLFDPPCTGFQPITVEVKNHP